ncbi:MAG: maleylacetoacetate isomerase [Betaproteobacteria bacterium]
MILYEYFRSSAAFRVRIALNLKGINPERRYIHLANGEQRGAGYLAVNPQGLVPYLVDDDAGMALGQSLAIIEYLDETEPDPPLLPKDAQQRAWVRSVAQMISCDIHPLNNTRVLGYLSNELKVSDEVKNRWYAHWVTEGFAAVEKVLEARKVQSPFCLGETPTLADICLIPQVANANRFKVPLENFPTIVAIYHHAMKLSAFNDAQPSKQPDFPKPA